MDDTRIPDQPLLSARGVTKSYRAGERTISILHGIDLDVPSGQVCAVMGPSGSGKSTLMYCLAGLEQADAGQISLLGTDVRAASRTQLAELRRGPVGFVFQSYNLMPTMTAYENVALPFRLRGDKPQPELVEQALASVGLARLAKSVPSTMSGGEQQRVALARVLAQQPTLIFADEPTGALDQATGALVLAELLRLGRLAGRGGVIVTHDPSVAAQCDQVVFLLDGRRERVLTPTCAEEVAAVLGSLTADAARAAAAKVSA